MCVRPPRFPLYSDVLYQPFLCSAMRIDPRWLRVDNIARVRADALSVADFLSEYERPNRPVLIEGAASAWPALPLWTLASLQQRFGDIPFRCGAVDMALDDFAQYCDGCRDDRRAPVPTPA